ncbi:MAG: hypothetical protein DWQ06_03350 [Calditrichaeota bacterium]|nr:MAG: hypothetical protein DWQ06_03350 [Calditrichota bacterium]
MSFIDRLKDKWGIKRTIDVVLILIVFSLAGSSVMFFTKPVLLFFGVDESTPTAIWWTARILLIVPIYQVLLIVYGTLLGQFYFFWEKEKKMGRWIVGLFTKN